MKKILFICIIICIILALALLSLSKKSSSKQGVIEQANSKLTFQNGAANKNTDKIKSIITKLSSRAQSEITINDYDEFYNDLQNVLRFNEQSANDDISLLTLVDKKHFLQSDYSPTVLISLEKNNDFNINRNDLSLRKVAYDALVNLSKKAKNDGITLLASSSYRSYDYQEKLFAKWVALDGLEEAERSSARAGTSQHQLGTVIDFGSITDEFADTKMGKWLSLNASTYGWSLSFPKGYEDVTGYRWESWHFRYIGTIACNFQKKYFNDVQQFMLEFIDIWLSTNNNNV